jgi:hypothetical protein
MTKGSWISGGGEPRPNPGVAASLDELAKGLASGTLSRGKALRLMGGALVGAALASVPGVTWAAFPNGGNSACAQFCTQAFLPGREREQCISQGARGAGPCYECTRGDWPWTALCCSRLPRRRAQSFDMQG